MGVQNCKSSVSESSDLDIVFLKKVKSEFLTSQIVDALWIPIPISILIACIPVCFVRSQIIRTLCFQKGVNPDSAEEGLTSQIVCVLGLPIIFSICSESCNIIGLAELSGETAIGKSMCLILNNWILSKHSFERKDITWYIRWQRTNKSDSHLKKLSVHPAKTQICPVWSGSLLFAWWHHEPIAPHQV